MSTFLTFIAMTACSIGILELVEKIPHKKITKIQ